MSGAARQQVPAVDGLRSMAGQSFPPAAIKAEFPVLVQKALWLP